MTRFFASAEIGVIYFTVLIRMISTCRGGAKRGRVGGGGGEAIPQFVNGGGLALLMYT
jgi:hypothetical protein